MIKNITALLVVGILLSAAPVQAQIDVGVIGGVHLTSNRVDPDDFFDVKSRPEFGFGGVIGIPLMDALSLKIEVLYLRKGSDIRVTGFDEDVEVVAEYIEFPIMAKYSFDAGGIHPYLIAGPTIGFLLSARQTASFIPSEAEDIKDDTESLDLGIGIGAGVDLPIGSNTLFAHVKYLYGLMNKDADDGEADQTESIHSQGIAIMLGFTFPLGGK